MMIGNQIKISKLPYQLTIIFCCHLLFSLSYHARDWTIKESGNILNAKFLSLDHGVVRLRHYNNNTVYEYPATQFIEVDQDHIIKMILKSNRLTQKNYERIKRNFDSALIEAGLIPGADKTNLIHKSIKVLHVSNHQNLLALDENNQMIGVRMNTTDIHRGDTMMIVGNFEDTVYYENNVGEKKSLDVYQAIPDLTEKEFIKHLKNHIFINQLVYYHESLYAVIK
jgi:hypothetical protein